MNNNLHPIFAQALAPFDNAKQVAIDRGLDIARLRRELVAERDRMAKLLRTPFEVDMSRDPYSECMGTVDEEIVFDAIDECIERHMGEIEARVIELLEQRKRLQMLQRIFGDY